MGLQNIRDLIHSYTSELRIRQYYLSDIKHSRSIAGLFIDFLFFRAIIMITVYIIVIYKTREPTFSFVTALATTIILTMLESKRKNRLYKIKRIQKRMKIAREHLTTRLLNLSPQEFKWQIMKLLSNTEGFSNIRSCKKILEACYKGRKTIVGVHHSLHEHPVGADDISAFIHSLRSDSYHAALFFSSRPFKTGCHQLIKDKTGIPVRLIDMHVILDMMETARMLPDNATIDLLVSEEIMNNTHRWKDVKQQLLTTQKVRNFSVYGVICLTVSLFTGNLRIYYVLLSLFFFMLAFFTYLAMPKTSTERDVLGNVTPGESE